MTTIKKNISGIFLISPMIIGLTSFILFPLLFSFVLSFYKWDGLADATFVGIQNYSDVVSDPLFWKSLNVTIIYSAISVPVNLVFGFVLALLLNKDTWLNQFLRVGFYIPQIISGVPLMILWLWIFNSRYGLVNQSLQAVGISGPSWFGNELYAMAAIIIMSLWGVGTNMIIFLATLQRIPTHLIDVVKLEGGGFRQIFRYAIFPYISPIVFFLLIVGFIGSAQVFSQAYVITHGGPNNATLFFSYYVYLNAFSFSKMGYASALAWIFFLVLTLITGVQFIISRFWVSYDELRIR